MYDYVAKLFIQKLFQITDKRYFVWTALALENRYHYHYYYYYYYWF